MSDTHMPVLFITSVTNAVFATKRSYAYDNSGPTLPRPRPTPPIPDPDHDREVWWLPLVAGVTLSHLAIPWTLTEWTGNPVNLAVITVLLVTRANGSVPLVLLKVAASSKISSPFR